MAISRYKHYHFPAELGLTSSPLTRLPPRVPEQNLLGKLHRIFLQPGCLFHHQTNSVKALKETQSTNPNQGQASSFLHPAPDL